MSPQLVPARDLVPQVAAEMIRLGFRRTHKSETGSIYLRFPGTPFEIRISDHDWSGFSATRYPQVVSSVALRPVPACEIPALACRLLDQFHRRCAVRKSLAV